jgi:hypothetical protein
VVVDPTKTATPCIALAGSKRARSTTGDSEDEGEMSYEEYLRDCEIRAPGPATTKPVTSIALSRWSAHDRADLAAAAHDEYEPTDSESDPDGPDSNYEEEEEDDYKEEEEDEQDEANENDGGRRSGEERDDMDLESATPMRSCDAAAATAGSTLGRAFKRLRPHAAPRQLFSSVDDTLSLLLSDVDAL